MPESRDDSSTGPLDLIGVPVGVAGVALVMWGIVRSEAQGWSDGSVLALIAIGLVLLPVVVWRSARHPAPLLDLTLFRARSFSVATAAFWFYSLGFTAGFLLNSFLLQRLWGMSVLATGFALTPGPIVGALSSAPLGSLSDRIGHRWVVTVGALLCSGSYLWIRLLAGEEQEFVRVFLPACNSALTGVGATIADGSHAAMSEIAPHQFPSANATIRTTQQVGYAIGISVALTLASRLDLDGFRAGYTWVVAAFAVAASVVAAFFPSGSATSRTQVNT